MYDDNDEVIVRIQIEHKADFLVVVIRPSAAAISLRRVCTQTKNNVKSFHQCF